MKRPPTRVCPLCREDLPNGMGGHRRGSAHRAHQFIADQLAGGWRPITALTMRVMVDLGLSDSLTQGPMSVYGPTSASDKHHTINVGWWAPKEYWLMARYAAGDDRRIVLTAYYHATLPRQQAALALVKMRVGDDDGPDSGLVGDVLAALRGPVE